MEYTPHNWILHPHRERSSAEVEVFAHFEKGVFHGHGRLLALRAVDAEDAEQWAEWTADTGIIVTARGGCKARVINALMNY